MANHSKCDQIPELLDAYHDHELADDEQILVEQHLSQCADCNAKLADIARLVLDLKAMPRLVPARDIVDNVDFDKLIAHSTKSSFEVVPLAVPAKPVLTTASDEHSADRAAVPVTGKVLPMHPRVIGGAFAGAVAVAALAFAVVLNKPNSEPTAGVAQAPVSGPTLAREAGTTAPVRPVPCANDNEQLAASVQNNQRNSIATDVHEKIDTSAVTASNAAESVAKKPSSVSNKSSQTLVASSAVGSGNAPVETAISAGGDTQRTIAFNDAQSSVEIAALGEGDDMTDSLGVATDEDGLYEIKI